MQDFRDNEKKTIKNDRLGAILDFISAKFVMGYPCDLTFCFIFMVLLFCFFTSPKCHKTTQIQSGR